MVDEKNRNPHTSEAAIHDFVGMMRTYFLAAVHHGFSEDMAFSMMLAYQTDVILNMSDHRHDEDA